MRAIEEIFEDTWVNIIDYPTFDFPHEVHE